MTDTCRAAVFLGDHSYEVREFAVPDPPPGGAVLQVEAVGLCGSDVAQYGGVELVPGACVFPVVPGHETVGRVAKLASDAALGVEEGDRVAVNEILMAAGPLRLYGYSDMRGDGEVGLWGGYGEYMEIFPGTELHRMSSALPAEQLTLFEPLAERGALGRHRGRAREGDRRRAGAGPPGARGARSGAGQAAAPGDRHRHVGRRAAPRRGQGDRRVERGDGRQGGRARRRLRPHPRHGRRRRVRRGDRDRNGADGRRPRPQRWSHPARGVEALRRGPGTWSPTTSC